MSTSNSLSGRLSGSRSLLKALPLLLMSLLWAHGAWARECVQTDYDLNTQAEVDALGDQWLISERPGKRDGGKSIEKSTKR